MTLKNLDTVVLVRDLPEHGLKAGDLGTVVEVLASDVMEVEFLRASGQTQAVIDVRIQDLRPTANDDVISVRRAGKPS